MNHSDSIKNSLAIVTSTCIAILLIQENSFLLYAGIAGVCLLFPMALVSPWLGLLAIFPLAFALHPAPASIGLPEFSFATLLGAVFFATLIGLARTSDLKRSLKRFAYPLLIGLGMFGINLAMAIKNAVPLADWVRGAIPFLFIYTLLPIAVLVKNDESRIRWLGASVGVLIFLVSGYVVFYYFYHDVWKAYWMIQVDGENIKVSQEAALGHLSATGPYRDRITMLVAQATDALLPIGVVAGLVVSTLARNRSVTIIGMLMSLLCVSAVLITFTRSMLLSAMLVIALFSILVLIYHKALRKKISALAAILCTFTFAFILATGMQSIWLGRMCLLVESGIQAFNEILHEVTNYATDCPTPVLTNTALMSTTNFGKRINPTLRPSNKPMDLSNTSPLEEAKVEIAKVDEKHSSSPHHKKTGERQKLGAKAQSKPQPHLPQQKEVVVEQSKAIKPETLPSTKDPEAEQNTVAASTSDFNVSSRIEEYQIAWKMFLEHPLLGNGLGVKHEMRWEASETVSFTQSVAYVHNWPLYILMVGGGLGFLIYFLVLSGPVVVGFPTIASESMHWTVIRAIVITMVVYASFFAVFRLITFNLILAAAWGILLSNSLPNMKKASNIGDLIKVDHESETQEKKMPAVPESTKQNDMELSV